MKTTRKTRIKIETALEMIRTKIESVPLCTLNDLMVASMYEARITNDDFNKMTNEVLKRGYK